ncbi:MAG: ABC transporter permease [Fidelibacterota bacterium]|jgi:ABC-2 type transport system permease protein|tara:strand:+ start:2925 stop:3764 length:840 start_codon:yes stop_codon:yes gene_type:complete
MILNLLKNELVKIIKRKRSYISFSLIIVLIPFIVGAIDHGGNTLEKSLYGQLADSFLFVGSLINGYLATYIIIAILISHMPFLSTIVASEIVSGEYSKSTFRMYLSRPVSRRKVLLSKLIIVFIYTTLLMFFFIFYSLLISTLWLGKGDLAVFHKGLLFLSENDVIWRFLLAFILSNIVMITVSSLCFFISTISSNSVTPIIITISIVFIGTAISLIPIDLFQLINPYLFTGYINIFLTAFYDPIPWFTVLKMTIVCSFWSFIFILLSFYIFEKRDITE